MSGNRNDRPPGATLGGRLRKAVAEEFDSIVARLIQAAKSGDLGAAQILLARTVPAVRPVHEPLSFDLLGRTPAERAESVTDALASGTITPDQADTLMGVLSQQARLIESAELAERVKRLEEKLK